MIKTLMQFFFFRALFFLFFTFELLSKERHPSYPFISGDGFRAIAHHVLDEDSPLLNLLTFKDKEIIFVKTEFLEEFFSYYYPKILSSFILITHNSDLPIPGPFFPYLSDKKIIAWLGQNIEKCQHAKLHPLPIGITNRYNRLGDMKIYEYLQFLKNKKNIKKEFLAYFNVTIETCSDERKKAYDFFSKKSFCYTIDKFIHPRQYFKNLMKSTFIVSPRGNGLDCHRTWEALYFGSIPIVKSSLLDPLFEDLPVLIVKEWEEIDQNLLLTFYEERKGKRFDFSKIYFPYWEKKIRELLND